MRGGKAEIGLGSREGREVEGVGLAAHERPAAPDDPFDDLAGKRPAPAPRKTETADASPKASKRARDLPCNAARNERNDEQHRRQRRQHVGRPCRNRSGCGPATGSACRAAASGRSRAHRTSTSARRWPRRRSPSVSSAWRASLRAASARRECDGGRTSCARRATHQGEELREIIRGFADAGVSGHLTPCLRSGRSRSKSPCLAKCCSRRCGVATL